MRALMPVVAGAALLVFACEPKTRDVVVKTDLTPGTSADVSVYGNRLGKVTAPEMRFAAPAWVRNTTTGRNSCALPPCRGDASPSILLHLENRCGAADWCVRFENDGRGATPLKRGETLTATLSGVKLSQFDLCTDASVTMRVDNRGGAARVLTVGSSFSHAIAGGAVDVFEAPAPTCAAESRVALDGTTAGTLPLLEDPRPWNDPRSPRAHEFLVDPTAAHCYSSTTSKYEPNGGFSLDGGPDVVTHHGAKMYEIDHVDDFLKPSPKTIESAGGYGTRTDLLDVPCGK